MAAYGEMLRNNVQDFERTHLHFRSMLHAFLRDYPEVPAELQHKISCFLKDFEKN